MPVDAVPVDAVHLGAVLLYAVPLGAVPLDAVPLGDVCYDFTIDLSHMNIIHAKNNNGQIKVHRRQ